MPAPTFLLVAGYKDAPKAPERDYDADLDASAEPNPDDPNAPVIVPKRKRQTRQGATSVGRAGIRTGTDPETVGLGQGGFVNPVRRRMERMRSTSGFTPAEEAELKTGFAVIQGLVTSHVVPGLAPDEPSDAEIEAAFNKHVFVGGPRAKYCRQASCFRARTDAVHAG